MRTKSEKSKLWGSPVHGFLLTGDLDQVEAGVRDEGALPSSFCFYLLPEERQARKRKTVVTLCVLREKKEKKNLYSCKKCFLELVTYPKRTLRFLRIC